MNEPGYRIDARHRAWAWSVLVETFIRGSIMGMSTRNSGSVILNGEFQESYKKCVFDCKWHERFAARKVDPIRNTDRQQSKSRQQRKRYPEAKKWNDEIGQRSI